VVAQPHRRRGSQEFNAGGDRVERGLGGVAGTFADREGGEVGRRDRRQGVESGPQFGRLGPQRRDPAAASGEAGPLRAPLLEVLGLTVQFRELGDLGLLALAGAGRVLGGRVAGRGVVFGRQCGCVPLGRRRPPGFDVGDAGRALADLAVAFG
jgi:hypothetical protein